jgi:dUTP pyrophosphatase
MDVKIINKSNNPDPSYKTIMSAGLDLHAFISSDILLKPLERRLISTGLFLELPFGTEAQVRPRSGFALKQGVTVLNSPGTIDADYRGEVGVILINLSNEDVTISSGDRIAQLVIAKYERVNFVNVLELSSSDRGDGGFGSTGK